MRKKASLRYLLKEGVRNLWVNRILTFTSLGVLTTCLIIVGAARLITKNVESMVYYIEGQSEMSVFLKDIVTDTTNDSDTTDQNKVRVEQVNSVKEQILALENVKTCEYISKEQGLENTKEMLGDAGYLLDGIKDRNYIPDTFVLTVVDLSKTRETKATIEKISGVDLVIASTEVSDTLTHIQKMINTLGTAIILALSIISLVIVSNTIRATIFARRKEINIMKFVGATNSFIKIPFITEGFLLGLISAIISFLIVWASYQYVLQAFTSDASAWLQSAFQSLIPFKDIALEIGLFFTVVGIFIGTVGSFISIRNHARV